MNKTKFGSMNKFGEVKNIMSVDLNKLNSSDPLAFAFGMSQGMSGAKMSKDKDLAPEYIRGFKEGRKKRK